MNLRRTGAKESSFYRYITYNAICGGYKFAKETLTVH